MLQNLKDSKNVALKGSEFDKLVYPILNSQSTFLKVGLPLHDSGDAAIVRFAASLSGRSRVFDANTPADEIQAEFNSVEIDNYRKTSNTYSRFDAAELSNTLSATFTNTIGNQAELIAHNIDLDILTEVKTWLTTNKATNTSVLSSADEKDGKKVFEALSKIVMDFYTASNSNVLEGVDVANIKLLVKPIFASVLQDYYASTGHTEKLLEKGLDGGLFIRGVKVVVGKKLGKNIPAKNPFAYDNPVDVSKISAIVFIESAINVVHGSRRFGSTPNTNNLNLNYITEFSYGVKVFDYVAKTFLKAIVKASL